MNCHLYEGQYLTLHAIAKRCGMKPATLHHRVVVMGLSVDDAIQAGKRIKAKPRQPRLYDFRGKRLTVKEIANRLGLCWSTIYRRVSGDRLLDGADLIDPNPSYQDAPINARLLTFRGRTDTVAGWARRMGVPKHTIFARLAMGWPIKRILTEPPMRGRQRTVFNHNKRCITRIAATFTARKDQSLCRQ